MITAKQNERANNYLNNLYFDAGHDSRPEHNCQSLQEKTLALVLTDRLFDGYEAANRMLASRARRASIFNKMVALWGGRK